MPARPNILFILSDQHRADCVGYADAYPVRTPNIDRIAAEGMRFDRAFTPIPLCCPARQALINGRRPETFGALWNYDNGLPIPALAPTEYSWVRELKAADYRTGYVGKWHVNPTHDPRSFGFDDYIEREYGAFREARHPGSALQLEWMGVTDPVPVTDSRTHWMADRAVELIYRYENEGASWHLRLDFHEPHLPCNPCEPFASLYDPAAVPQWAGFEESFRDKPYIQQQQLRNWSYENLEWKDWAPAVARYYGIITQMDDAIGKVIAELEARGILDDTIVVYSTDHGDMCGSHRMMDKHYVLYDDIVRVPLAIRWPGGIQAGTRSDAFVYNCLDLAPTILDILELPSAGVFHGRSLRPILQGSTPPDWRQQVVSTYNGQQFGLYVQRMLRDESWKYIWNPTDVDELYDLSGDPHELDNRIHDPSCRSIIADMRKRLVEELTAVDDGMVTRSKWMRDQLLSGNKI